MEVSIRRSPVVLSCSILGLRYGCGGEPNSMSQLILHGNIISRKSRQDNGDGLGLAGILSRPLQPRMKGGLGRMLQLRDFKLVGVLGEGGFARVYAAVHRPSGREVALKISTRSRVAGDNLVSASFSAGNSSRQASLRADVVRSEVVALARCMARGVQGPCAIGGVVVGDDSVGVVLE